MGDGVCNICHGAPGAGYERCWSCTQTMAQVSEPVDLVVPISLCANMSQLHHVLRSYKDAPRQAVRDAFSVRVAALLHRFVARHRTCIRNAAGRDWNTVTVVPSSTGRAGTHPLESVIRMTGLADEYLATLRPGPVATGHNLADDSGFETTADVEDASILIVDDMFTSGARAQSAASAPQVAGATVVAILPIARYIKPEFNVESRELFDAARDIRFSFGTCCLE